MTSPRKKRDLWTAALCALALCFTLFVFAPIEQFMLNQGEFWFSLADLAPALAMAFAAVLAALLLAAFLLPAVPRRGLAAALLALTLCLYLQGNALNPDYGELDGRQIAWGAYTTVAVWDTLFWLALPAAVAALAIRKKKLFKKVARAASALLLTVQSVTLIVVFATQPLLDKRFDWIVSDRDQFVLAPNVNTVVFVVDACDNTYVPQMLAEAPDIFEPLEGFTWFSDYAGSYSKTKMGFPYLMTQQWYENDETVEDYIDRCYEDVPLYDTLRKAGWGVRLYTSETYLSRRMLGVADNVLEANLTVGSPAKLFFKMMECTLFRYAPHLLKPRLVFYSGDFGFYKASDGEYQPYMKDNFKFMERYARDGLTVAGAENALIVYHINGSHLPCNMDEYGHNVGAWHTTALEQTKGVFRFLGRYLTDMKALGLYDRANIVITADHGRFDEGPSSPVLLIKPAGARGALTENRAMASVSDLHATLLSLCGFAHDAPGVFDLDENETRARRYLYYPTTRANGGTLPPLTEYRVERGQKFVETGVVLPGGAQSLR